ncbi:MAG: DNA methyltransferase [Phycisphaerales bacterium]|jgi:site-specific DNA-methyltransferase (adenine-specific)|nr:DNA methyltransferase [Phycisphaerales bacterium]
MAEKKNKTFDRHGGYSTPTGAISSQKHGLSLEKIRLLGDGQEAYIPSSTTPIEPTFVETSPCTELYVGDCREVLPRLKNQGEVDLVFADPPFNWDVPYEGWKDGMPRDLYERFTFDWLDSCISVLKPTGALWVNIPDDTVAEVVLHLKRRGLTMINWCVWHFRFGQHRSGSFIMSKVHALYFVKDPNNRTWNSDNILEQTDRASIYNDRRTHNKPSNKGMRVPMDVWYGKYWGRIQGNNKERRHGHHNQIPEVYLERVILACSNKGDLVLDPFCGSGTTGTVARAHHRRSISIEQSTTNSESAWHRITSIGMVRKNKSAGQSSAIFSNKQPT